MTDPRITKGLELLERYELAWKKIADVIEPHWKGAGAEPAGDWLLDAIVRMAHEADDTPAYDEGKLREIRERHEQKSNARHYWVAADMNEAHADRATLLAMLDGGRDG